MLPTLSFRSWTVHKIIEYLTLGLLSSLWNIYHNTTSYFFLIHPVLLVFTSFNFAVLSFSQNKGHANVKGFTVLIPSFLQCLIVYSNDLDRNTIFTDVSELIWILNLQKYYTPNVNSLSSSGCVAMRPFIKLLWTLCYCYFFVRQQFAQQILTEMMGSASLSLFM